jgi:ORF6N domain-containing protein
MAKSRTLDEVGRIKQRILLIRGRKVIIDADLAEAYGVTTKALNQAVRRNMDRFPPDFMFRLTREEKQEVVTNCDHLEGLKFSPVHPRAFTEHGAIMAARVLNSTRAIEVSLFVVRAFVNLREAAANHQDLARKMAQLERKLGDHDEQIRALFEAIQQLLDPEPLPKTRRIGFHPD